MALTTADEDPVWSTDEDGVQWAEDSMGKFRKDEKVWTMNMLRDLPLFMNDMPRDISENEHLLALQSLTFDGKTPEELALHFKQIGNDAFQLPETKASNQNALMAYTRALEMECTDKKILASIHSNRAAVSMRIKEWPSVIEDCRRAIQYEPTNLKAHFRAARASEELGLTERALKFCEMGLELASEDASCLAMKKRLEKKRAVEEKAKEAERVKMAQDAQEMNAADHKVKSLLEERGVKLGDYLFDMTMYRQRCGAIKPKLADDDISVCWPVMFLYDEHSQSDFIESFDERASLDEQLELMFPEDRPVEWDEDGKYKPDAMAVYAEVYQESSESKMVKIRLDEALQDQLNGHRLPRCLVFHVLVDKTPAHAHFCSEHDLD